MSQKNLDAAGDIFAAGYHAADGDRDFEELCRLWPRGRSATGALQDKAIRPQRALLDGPGVADPSPYASRRVRNHVEVFDPARREKNEQKYTQGVI